MQDAIRLELASIDSLLRHEETKGESVFELVKQIERAGVIRNPLPVFESEGDYIVLDGHHRLEALKQMGLQLVPVQIVPPEHITLRHWYHVVAPNWRPTEQMLNGTGRLLGVFQVENRQMPLRATERDDLSFLDEVWTLHRQYAASDYTRQHAVEATDCSVQFSGITLEDVVVVARQERILPPGITRFQIAYRVLHLNVPLEVLKVGDLEGWSSLCRRVARGRVYSEPVVCVES